MIRAIVWKEVREHGSIALALIVLGGAILVSVGFFAPPPPSNVRVDALLSAPGILGLFMLVTSAGLVIGASLVANERENRTATFLELLPVPRSRLLLGKAMAGVVLAVPIIGSLFLAAAVSGVIGPMGTWPLWGGGIVFLGLTMTAWGLFGSTLAKSSLAAAAWGAIAAVVFAPMAAVVFFLANVLLFVVRRTGSGPVQLNETFFLGLLFAMFVAPLLLSWWTYTAPDRNRVHAATTLPRRKVGEKPTREGWTPWRWRVIPAWRAGFWLANRQVLPLLYGFVPLGLLFGGTLLIPGAPFAILWPILSLFLSVLIGVLIWNDEVAGGNGRFWLERRLPIDPLFAGKLAAGILATALVLVVALLPLYGASRLARQVRSNGPVELFLLDGVEELPFLLLWGLYGAAFGQAIGLLFRKGMVAIAVALMVGATAAVLWLPSFFVGGLAWWSWLLPLGAVLVATRALLWPSLAERLGRVASWIRIGAGVAAISAAMVLGLGYRMWSVPDVGPELRERDLAYRQNELPIYDLNLSGRELRRIAGLYANAQGFDINATQADYFGSALDGYGPNWSVKTQTFKEWATRILEHGWVDVSEKDDAYLTSILQNGWNEALDEAVKLPYGVIEDPSELNLMRPFKYLYALKGIDRALLLVALRDQAQGRPESFVRAARLILALARHVRHKSVLHCWLFAVEMERELGNTLQHWLVRLKGREDLLKALAAEYEVHRAFVAKQDPDDRRLAEQVLLRETIKSPGGSMKDDERGKRLALESNGRYELEVELLAFSWQVPWERERLQRIVGIGNHRRYARSDMDWLEGLPRLWPWFFRQAVSKPLDDDAIVRGDLATGSAAILVALRRYELMHGAPPTALADLAPEFLSAVPNDPYSGKPYGYRLSEGELLMKDYSTAPPGPLDADEYDAAMMAVVGPLGQAPTLLMKNPQGTRQSKSSSIELKAGRPVLWSAGRDRIDQGGTRVDREAKDVVFLVPVPLKEIDR